MKGLMGFVISMLFLCQPCFAYTGAAETQRSGERRTLPGYCEGFTRPSSIIQSRSHKNSFNRHQPRQRQWHWGWWQRTRDRFNAFERTRSAGKQENEPQASSAAGALEERTSLASTSKPAEQIEPSLSVIQASPVKNTEDSSYGRTPVTAGSSTLSQSLSGNTVNTMPAASGTSTQKIATSSSVAPNIAGTQPGGEFNKTNNPVGGGSGYTDVITANTAGVKTVSTASELKNAVSSAKSGDIVFLASHTVIDLGSTTLSIPAGVTLASDRGVNGSQGGKIVSSASRAIQVNGNNVRITGIRLEGPDTGTNGSAERSGIGTTKNNLEIDNCEIYGWGVAGISAYGTAKDLYVHHNYIHHTQLNGLGYGVTLGESATALIEGNYFDYFRHAIAGSGTAGQGYEARYNICGDNLTATSHHAFDMHGQAANGTTIAGEYVNIHHNVFLNDDFYSVIIRGNPSGEAIVSNNWFASGYTPMGQTMQHGGNLQEYFVERDNYVGTNKQTYTGGIKLYTY